MEAFLPEFQKKQKTAFHHSWLKAVFRHTTCTLNDSF